MTLPTLAGLVFIALWLIVFAASVGIVIAVASAVAILIAIELVRFVVHVIHISRHPLDSPSPTNDELERFR